MMQTGRNNNEHQQFPKVNREDLSRLVELKDEYSLQRGGGINGIASALDSGLPNGIAGNPDDIHRRRSVFGSNIFAKSPGPISTKAFLHFVLEALKEISVLLLLCSAILSLLIGIKKHGWKDGWYEGGFIFLNLLAIVVVTAISNFRQAKQLQRQSNKRNNHHHHLQQQLNVVRDRKIQKISTMDIVVGDIVQLTTGVQIPADGLFFAQFGFVVVDDASLTGETSSRSVVDPMHPFLSAGNTVIEVFPRVLSPEHAGVFMLVTSVGMNSAWGRLLNPIGHDVREEKTGFQAQFDKLSSYKESISLIVALLLLLLSFISCFSGKKSAADDEKHHMDINAKKTEISEVINTATAIIRNQKVVLKAVATAATVFLLVIPEGLSLAVTLLLVRSTRHMMRTVPVKVQKLFPCISTLTSVTTIITNKSSILMAIQKQVTEFRLGEQVIKEGPSALSKVILKTLQQGLGLTTTGCHSSDFVPSPTDKALHSWAVRELHMDIEEVKRTCTIIHVEDVNSEQLIGVSTRKTGEDEKMIHVNWKGCAKKILGMCSSYYERNGNMNIMGKSKREKFEKIVESMEARGLECIAFAHKQTIADETNATGMQKLQDSGLTLLGLVGLENLSYPKGAVEACRDAGINIIMVSRDYISTAEDLAINCGILTPPYLDIDKAVVNAEEFRSNTTIGRMEMVDRIRVMAWSSPSDMLLLVQSLQQKGHVVAVTGAGISDVPTLEAANVGFSMGIQGAEIVKESSDIVIMDDNLASVAAVFRWGQCNYNNIQKFIQLHLTINIVGLIVNFITTVSLGEHATLTTFQVLWVNLIIGSMGALALAGGLPDKELVMKQQIGQSTSLITNVMWRNIVTQALYQIFVLLILQFKGGSILGIDESATKSLVFNIFVFLQIFNELNARETKEKNVFKGICQARLFCGTVGATIVLQVALIEFLRNIFDTQKLNLGQWGICIGIAAVSLPVDWITKSIPVPDRNRNLYPDISGMFSRLRLSCSHRIFLVRLYCKNVFRKRVKYEKWRVRLQRQHSAILPITTQRRA